MVSYSQVHLRGGMCRRITTPASSPQAALWEVPRTSDRAQWSEHLEHRIELVFQNGELGCEFLISSCFVTRFADGSLDESLDQQSEGWVLVYPRYLTLLPPSTNILYSNKVFEASGQAPSLKEPLAKLTSSTFLPSPGAWWLLSKAVFATLGPSHFTYRYHRPVLFLLCHLS